MKRTFLERWAPLIISLIAFFVVIGCAWYYDSQMAALRTRLEERESDLFDQKEEMRIWQAHTVQLRIEMNRAGIRTPESPMIVIKKSNKSRKK